MKTTILTLAALLSAGLALTPNQADAQGMRRRPAVRRDWAVRPLVVRTERESNAFRGWFERSAYRKNTNLKRNIQALDENLERLRGEASDSRPGVGRDELNRALGYARVIDRQITPRRKGPIVNREWDDLHRTLNQLARVYGVRPV